MRVPVATYRIQFTPDYGFKEAMGLVGYLKRLGISDIYASPVFRAKRGSTHGYDVTDPCELNPAFGGAEEFEALSGKIKDLGMGWIQDFVSNHMAYDYENTMLTDVLENGHGSRYAKFFDIDWNHPGFGGKLLAPFLGKFYGEALENGEIRLCYDENGFTVDCFPMRFPLKMGSYLSVLAGKLEALEKRLGEEHPDYIKFLGILYVLKSLPLEGGADYEQIWFVKRMLWELYARSPEIRGFIDGNMETINGMKGTPDSFNLLDELLSEQLFRLSFWKVATEEINYRRFFNINDLISLRIEEEEVFSKVHSLVLSLLSQGKITGLRIDHVDGLYDPANYVERIRERARYAYVIIEKILGPEEELPSWPVQGTTGYDFLNVAGGLFCDRENGGHLTRTYARFTGLRVPYSRLLYEKRKLIIEKEITGDVDNLAHLAKGISGRDRHHGIDITLHGLKSAIVEVMAFFPVYRTYTNAGTRREADRIYVKDALGRARVENPALLYELDYLEKLLLLSYDEYLLDEERGEWLHFAMRFQQLTGPLMAKSVEDTTLYVYNRLLSLNEVGGSPERFGVSLEEFHAFNERRVNSWPDSLNATSTHDTKRGEDARARINVLSELPEEWEKNLKSWCRVNRKKKKFIRGQSVPDKNDEYFLYQTLLGAFPLHEGEYEEFIERVKNYIIKAVREARIHTGWLKPDTEYEEAFVSFVDDLLAPGENLFLEKFMPLLRKTSWYGMLGSLSRTLLKITSPGVPDFYQGSELWDLNLVDPDNRRPVDFEKRTAMLKELRGREGEAGLPEELLRNWRDGRVKLFLTYRALRARLARRELFCKGAYVSLAAEGAFGEHVVAFARSHAGAWSVTVAPRLFASLWGEGESPVGSVWDDTRVILPEGCAAVWEDAITGRTLGGKKAIELSEALRAFPVALLVNQEEKGREGGEAGYCFT